MLTADWYENFFKNKNAVKITIEQIQNYQRLFFNKNKNYA